MSQKKPSTEKKRRAFVGVCRCARSLPIRNFFALPLTGLIVFLLFIVGAQDASAQWGQGGEKPANTEVFSRSPKGVKQNPLVTFYDDPEYTPTLLKRIAKDTGDETVLSSSLPIISLRTKVKERVFMVTSSAVDNCGKKYTIYRKSRRTKDALGTFTELLRLECVEGVYLTRKKSFTKSYPDLLYVSGKSSDHGLYTATFKYDGAQYREAECKTRVSKKSRQYTIVECNGRGIVPR